MGTAGEAEKEKLALSASSRSQDWIGVSADHRLSVDGSCCAERRVTIFRFLEEDVLTVSCLVQL